MHISINHCDICGSYIPKQSKIYRAYDSTSCSELCISKKHKIIKTIDPTYNKPTSWQSTNTMTRTKSQNQLNISNKLISSAIINIKASNAVEYNDYIEEKYIPYSQKEYEIYTQTYRGFKFLYLLGTSVSLYTIKYFLYI